ncbi:TPA: hypothetical protein I9Z31_001109 [Clostridium perfringens]|nr:hypothetical protein [Clostridium perfringens]
MKKMDKYILYGIIFFLLTTFLGVCIAIIFRSIDTNYNSLRINDYFQFTASFGGSVLGVFITFLIFNGNIEIQNNNLNKEKIVQKEKLKINTDLSTYKELYNICKEILKELEFIISEIEYYRIEYSKKYKEKLLITLKKSLNNIDSLISEFIFIKATLNESNKDLDNIKNLNNSIKIYNDLNESKLKGIIDKSNNMSNTVNKCICEILKQVSNLNKNLLEI